MNSEFILVQKKRVAEVVQSVIYRTTTAIIMVSYPKMGVSVLKVGCFTSNYGKRATKAGKGPRTPTDTRRIHVKKVCNVCVCERKERR